MIPRYLPKTDESVERLVGKTFFMAIKCDEGRYVIVKVESGPELNGNHPYRIFWKINRTDGGWNYFNKFDVKAFLGIHRVFTNYWHAYAYVQQHKS